MERKLTAIFSADVKGYSRLIRGDEEATIRTLTAYREVMITRKTMRKHLVGKGSQSLAVPPFSH